MGLRFRKSVKIGKGMKMNFSKSGVGASFGIPGFSYSVGKKGSYINAGIPGTEYRTAKRLEGLHLRAEVPRLQGHRLHLVRIQQHQKNSTSK